VIKVLPVKFREAQVTQDDVIMDQRGHLNRNLRF